MLSDEIRARLAQIHAARPREQPTPHIAIGLHSTLAAGPIRHEPAPDLFERGQECTADCGPFLRFRRQLSGFELRPAGPAVAFADDAAAVPARARAKARLELQALAE